jgi:hypothetical protein
MRTKITSLSDGTVKLNLSVRWSTVFLEDLEQIYYSLQMKIYYTFSKTIINFWLQNYFYIHIQFPNAGGKKGKKYF